MQFLKVPYELITDTKITSNEFRVYTYLMSRFNESKNCAYPSTDVIAARIGISVRTVISCIKNLVKLGYMKITKKKGIYGNYNEYSELKYLVGTKEENKVPDKKEPKKEEVIKPTVQDEVEESVSELCEYTKEHQAKISLVLKYVKSLTEKQKDLIFEFDIEILRKAIRVFKKKKGRVFSFLINLYLDIAEQNDIEVSDDIVRYLSGSYARLTDEEKETRLALQELEMYGPYGLCS